METRSDLSGWLWIVLLFMALAVPAQAGLLGELCGGKGSGTPPIDNLVEEAEATGMSPATLDRLLEVGFQDGKSIDDLRRLLCAIILAEEAGLPPDSLFAKIAEGLGKRATLERIHAAVVHRTERLTAAQTLLAAGKDLPVDSLHVDRIADLPTARLTDDHLVRLFDPEVDAPLGMRVVAAEIHAYATMAGFPAALLGRIIDCGLSHHAFTPDWSYFGQVIQQARTQKIDDQTVTTAALHALSHREPLIDLISLLGIKRKPFYSGGNHR